MATKIDWYREVLELEPNSRVFFPLARLLSEQGDHEEAIRILEHGIERHPEYLEARICLIDLLYKNSMTAKCETEIEKLEKIFSSYNGFWQAWATCLAAKKAGGDAASILRFLAAHFISGPLQLHDVLNRGLDSILENATSGASIPESLASDSKACLAESAPVQDFLENQDGMPTDLDQMLNQENLAANPVEPTPQIIEAEPEASIFNSEMPAPHDASLEGESADPAQNIQTAEITNDLDGAADLEAEIPLDAKGIASDLEAEENPDLDEELTLPEPEIDAENLPVVESAPVEMDDVGQEIPETAPFALSDDETGIIPDLEEADIPTNDSAEMAFNSDSKPTANDASEIDAQTDPTGDTSSEEWALPEMNLKDELLPAVESEDLDIPEAVDEPSANANTRKLPATPNEIQAEVARAEAELMDGFDLPSMDTETPKSVQSAETADEPLVEEYADEEKFSLRTRSMAEVLAEQGDIKGALDIYQELAAAATSEDELNDINQRIATLKARLQMTDASSGFKAADAEAQARSKEKLIGMLEALAQRVEARANN